LIYFGVTPTIYSSKYLKVLLNFSLTVLEDVYESNKNNYSTGASISFWKSFGKHSSLARSYASIESSLKEILSPYISESNMSDVIKKIMALSPKEDRN